MMSPSSNGNWQYTVIDDAYYHHFLPDWGYDLFYDLAIDAAGKLYGTEGWRYCFCGDPYYFTYSRRHLYASPVRPKFSGFFRRGQFQQFDAGCQWEYVWHYCRLRNLQQGYRLAAYALTQFCVSTATGMPPTASESEVSRRQVK